MRDSSFPNLTRFITLNLHIQHFQLAFGKITFCAKALSPNFDLKIEKPKEEKKDGKQDDKKKEGKKPDQGGKKQKEAAKPAPKAEPAKATVDPAKQWEQSLPELPFDFYDFKTEFVNSKDKKAVLKKLYDDWNPKNLSFWHVQYQLGEPKEGEKLHFASNLLNGFL